METACAWVGHLLEENHYVIENIDATVIAQKPKLRPYMDEMKNKLCEALEIEENQLNLKATTEEGLGFTGSGEGNGGSGHLYADPASGSGRR